jgi:hypothetical protein
LTVAPERLSRLAARPPSRTLVTADWTLLLLLLLLLRAPHGAAPTLSRAWHRPPCAGHRLLGP